ncbi:MAG TPA: tetratricopeptide repeat protein [Candidatus Dormibacteraeota bacterium]|nr:tetratricopeptide repeat protein [Candidatus Dormibacteraeota bacterium]
MSMREQFTRADVCRILELSEKQLGLWEKMQFVAPLQPGSKETYDFRDLISLRAAKQLMQNGVSPNRLRLSLQALERQLSEVQAPLNQLRITSNGKDVIVETSGSRLEPISGQFQINFDTHELSDRVIKMPDRNAPGLFELALEYDGTSATDKAASAYERVLALQPEHLDATINRGMIAYEQGDLEAAVEYFKRAVEIAPENPIARFNLGSALDDQGALPEARQHLRLATRLDPQYADAHYNLGIVCEKMGALQEAHEHWKIYLTLDCTAEHRDYVRSRLLATHHH